MPAVLAFPDPDGISPERFHLAAVPGPNRAGLPAGNRLSEKPVAHDFRDVRRVAEQARASKLKTKVGLTFRYSPAVRNMKDMIVRGDLGTPFIYNAYEQNSQWLSPSSPAGRSARCRVASSLSATTPGIEVRVYGSEGAAVARLIEEFGICETLKVAKSDDVEFREVEVTASYYPPGGSPRESWRTLCYANLTANFASEVLGEIDGNEGNADDGLWVREVINAVELSHHERRWVSPPLDTREPSAEHRG